MDLVIQGGLLILGFVLLMKGADWFVEGAAKLASKFGIPQIIVGLTVVALGTSLPEAAVSITSALNGAADLTIGNVMGSNIMNVLLILGLTSLVCNIPVGKNSMTMDIPLVIVVTIFLVVVGLHDNVVSRLEGITLLLVMTAYIAYLGFRVRNGEELDEIPGNDKPMAVWKMLFFIIVGAVMITFGSNFAVNAATELAKAIGVSERIIGLTVVAFGTSLPELVTSVTAATKKKTDIAIGNIVGSNLFNVLFVVGATAVIKPVPYVAEFKLDSIVAIGAIVLLFVSLLPKKKLNKFTGILMLLGYIAYFITTVV